MQQQGDWILFVAKMTDIYTRQELRLSKISSNKCRTNSGVYVVVYRLHWIYAEHWNGRNETAKYCIKAINISTLWIRINVDAGPNSLMHTDERRTRPLACVVERYGNISDLRCIVWSRPYSICDCRSPCRPSFSLLIRLQSCDNDESLLWQKGPQQENGEGKPFDIPSSFELDCSAAIVCHIAIII